MWIQSRTHPSDYVTNIFCTIRRVISWLGIYKNLDLSKWFVADASMKNQKLDFTPSQSTLKYGSENRP